MGPFSFHMRINIFMREFLLRFSLALFGYAVHEAGGKARTEIPAGGVYTCSKIIKRQLVNVTTAGESAAQAYMGSSLAALRKEAFNQEKTVSFDLR